MDLLSQLTAFVRLGGRLKPFCPIVQGWTEDCPEEPPGVVPFHIVLSGICDFEIVHTRTRRRVVEGEIVVIPHGAHHRFLPVSAGEKESGPTRILCGWFLTAPIRDGALLMGMPDHFVIQTKERTDFSWVPKVLDMMELESKDARLGAFGLISDLSAAIFTLILRAWMETQTSVLGVLAMAAHPALQKVAMAMLSEPDKAWTIGTLAEQAHVSRATLARLAQKHGAPAPMTLLTDLRMHRAAQLLERGNFTVGRVAEFVGYVSEAAFNRAFKRSFGVAPGRFAISRRHTAL